MKKIEPFNRDEFLNLPTDHRKIIELASIVSNLIDRVNELMPKEDAEKCLCLPLKVYKDCPVHGKEKGERCPICGMTDHKREWHLGKPSKQIICIGCKYESDCEMLPQANNKCGSKEPKNKPSAMGDKPKDLSLEDVIAKVIRDELEGWINDGDLNSIIQSLIPAIKVWMKGRIQEVFSEEDKIIYDYPSKYLLKALNITE